MDHSKEGRNHLAPRKSRWFYNQTHLQKVAMIDACQGEIGKSKWLKNRDWHYSTLAHAGYLYTGTLAQKLREVQHRVRKMTTMQLLSHDCSSRHLAVNVRGNDPISTAIVKVETGLYMSEVVSFKHRCRGVKTSKLPW